MVGLLASPLLITQGSGKWSPQTSVGGHLARPPLDHTDHTRLPRVELRVSVHQDADIMLEAERPVAYLHLLTYHR